MEFTRNHYFLVGLVVLLLGIQVKLVDSYVLNEQTTRVLTQQSSAPAARMVQMVPTGNGVVRKVVTPPVWLGYALMSIGSVLILHSLAMPKPSG